MILGALLALGLAAEASPLKALSFNVAGIPLVHERWRERREAIGRRLADARYDLVALQEVWLDKDARLLQKASGLLYYARNEDHALAGDGLEILSRFPILRARHIAFRCAPPGLWKFFQGETVANKGVLMARVETPSGELDVYDTHLVADYPSDNYGLFRLAQVFELFEMIRRESADRPFVLLGDLNVGPQDPEYALLRGLLSLTDACRKDGTDVCGPTNPEERKRIDHILAAPTARPARLAFIGGPLEYSDHRGVEAELSGGQWLRPGQEQAQALRELRGRLEEGAQAMVRRSRRRRWIPIYGFFHARRYERAFFDFEFLARRAETLLIADHKDCGAL